MCSCVPVCVRPYSAPCNDATVRKFAGAWTVVTASAAWVGRQEAALAVFDKLMFLVGGASANGTMTYGDVWTTQDGGECVHVECLRAWCALVRVEC
jgi:hypothetical protein